MSLGRAALGVGRADRVEGGAGLGGDGACGGAAGLGRPGTVGGDLGAAGVALEPLSV